MWSRLCFVLTAGFFLTMNVLLVVSEFGGGNKLGSAVPAEIVWQKVLTAPDNSTLEIRHHGVKIGLGRWMPAVGEDLATGRRLAEGAPPEGMVRTLSNYTIDFEGNLAFADSTRFRFSCDLKLSTNQVWQQFNLKLSARPAVWEIHSVAADQTVQFTSDEGDGRTQRTIKFADLQNPQKFLAELGDPALPGIAAAMGLGLPSSPAATVSLGLEWEARTDWLPIGHTQMRVYRLEARLLGRFRAVILVSLEGEILRVELPDDIVLTNDVLTSL